MNKKPSLDCGSAHSPSQVLASSSLQLITPSLRRSVSLKHLTGDVRTLRVQPVPAVDGQHRTNASVFLSDVFLTFLFFFVIVSDFVFLLVSFLCVYICVCISLCYFCLMCFILVFSK